jgi:hypothetical protein
LIVGAALLISGIIISALWAVSFAGTFIHENTALNNTSWIKIITYALKTLTQAIFGYSELLQMDFEQDTNTNNNDSIRNKNTFQKVLKVIVMSAKELQKCYHLLESSEK